MKKIFTFISFLPILLTSCGKSAGSISFFANKNVFETYYDDSYFDQKSSIYSQEIALASFASAMSTANSVKDYSIRYWNVDYLWKIEGFSNPYFSETFFEKPTLDSIGYAFASKKIKDYNLVAIVIRSGTYEAEWANNCTVGLDGNSKGFNDSAHTVLTQLESYITEHFIQGHTKFWISGYSRGGAVTNLVSAGLIDRIKDDNFFNGVLTSYDDIFGYCFEPPAPAFTDITEASNERYNGIHSVLNFNDAVPLVLPRCWGFARYGQSHYYPDRLTDIYFDYSERKKLISDYHFTYGAHNLPSYEVDNWHFYDPGEDKHGLTILPRESISPSLGRFFRQLVELIFASNLTRDNYALYIEAGIRDIFAAVFGYNEDIQEISINKALFDDLLFSYSFLQNMLEELLQDDIFGFSSDFEFMLFLLFNADETNIEAIHKLYEGIEDLLLFIALRLSMRQDIVLQLFSRDNILQLFDPHFSDLNYSFLRSCDYRVRRNDACKLNDGSYYILHIDNPETVTIYERHLNKNVFMYLNENMYSDTLSAEKFADGSINIYMPKNGTYDYRIEADLITLSNVDSYNIETVLKEQLPGEGII